MSLYHLSRVMWEITRDRDLAAAFVADPEQVLAGRDLDDQERSALRQHDLRSLFELGVHPFVLYHFALRLEGHISLQFMRDYLAELQGLSVGDLAT